MIGRGGRLSSLERRGPTRRPKRRILIFCEGKNTEPDYLHGLSKDCGDAMVAVEAIGASGVPSSLLQSAKDALRRIKREKNNYRKGDQVWILFDRDEHPCYQRVVSEARDVEVHAAYVNPCFEYWIILHMRDYTAPSNRVVVQKEVQNLLDGYVRKKGKRLDFSSVRHGLGAAISRARQWRGENADLDFAMQCPATNMDVLVSSILGKVGVERELRSVLESRSGSKKIKS